MRVGTAKVDITPPIGVELSGFAARMHPSTHVADRLYARAAALEVDGAAACIVSLDLLAIGSPSVARVRQQLALRGLGGVGVMFNASHTHSGPATVTLRDCGSISPSYIDYLEERLVQLVLAAYEDLKDCPQGCSMEHAQVSMGGFAMNRRASDGPIDSVAQVLRLSDADGSPRAYLVNYACHGVCMCDTSISGDYISHLCLSLEEGSCGKAVALFLAGPSGDINPRERGREAAVRMGEGLAHSILSSPQASWRPLGCGPLAVDSVEVMLPLAPLPTHDELAATLQAHVVGLASADPLTRKVARAMAGWALDVSKRVDDGSAGAHEMVEVMALRLGDVLLVGLPGEVFTAIGLRLRERLPGLPLLIAAHSGGTAGYVPNREEYAKGGYELDAYKWYDYPAALAPEASELLIGAAEGLAEGLGCGANHL